MFGRRQPFRIQPRMPVGSYQTFSVHMPRETHWRDATCEEAGCRRWANGWKTSFVPGTPEGEKIRFFIKNSPIKRKWTVVKLPGKTEVVFAAGQECFSQDHPTSHHKLPIARQQIHVVRKGDWRSAWDKKAVPVAEWIDRFATNQDKLKTLIERG